MKKFLLSILSVAVFFVGLGAIVEKADAKFKSDEKALEIVRKARMAIGGDAAIAEVRSLSIVGRTTHTFKTDGAERSEQGETEIAMQFPDKMMTMVKIGRGGDGQPAMINKQVEVVEIGDTHDAAKLKIADESTANAAPDGTHRIVIKRHDETGGGQDKQPMRMENGDGQQIIVEKEVAEAHHTAARNNELLRLTLGLLLTAPQGVDVNYTFAGESDVDGTAVNIVNAEYGGTAYKLFIGKSSNLPVAMGYTGHQMPKIVKFTKDGGAPGDLAKGDVMFTRKIDAEAATVERLVKFSDYRSTGGVQLPYKWTTSVAGATTEVFDITSYDVNPANIAEKFSNQKTFVRTAKPVQN